MTRKLPVLAAALGAVLLVALLLVWQPWAGDEVEDAEIAAGRELAAACTVCHAMAQDDAPRVGPPLWQVVGRPIGSIAGYGYSTALMAAEGNWTVERLDRYLADPAADLPGTAMVFAGFADPADRARVIAFLSSLTN